MFAVLAWLLGGYVAYRVITHSTTSKPVPVPQYDWPRVNKIFPSTPPPPPFYFPNAISSESVLCQFGIDGNNTPEGDGNGNLAIDVRGEPWGSKKVVASLTGFSTTDQVTFDAFTGGYPDFEVYDPKQRKLIVLTRDMLPSWQWVSYNWSNGPDFTDKVIAATQRYFIPAVITLAGSAVGGLGGAVLATALEATWSIANGMRIDDALIQSYKDRLQGTILQSAYGDAYKQVVSTYNQTKSDIEAVRAQVMQTYGAAFGSSPGASSESSAAKQQMEEAINAGVGVARAKILQDVAIYAVKVRASAADPKYGDWLDKALSHGVMFQDWVLAMYGARGADLLTWSHETAGKALDMGQDPIKAVTPITVVANGTVLPGNVVSHLGGNF